MERKEKQQRETALAERTIRGERRASEAVWNAGFHGDNMGAVVGTLTMQTKQRRPSRGKSAQTEPFDSSSRSLKQSGSPTLED